MCVVVYHTVFTGWGLRFPDGPGGVGWLMPVLQRLWIGVPLFFVISGYCVTASADALRRRPGAGAQFFWRRFRRIYPPYWIWFGVAGAAVAVVDRFIRPGFFQSGFVPDPTVLTPWQWVGNLTLTETWRWHLTGGVQTAFLTHSWTLCYEEQFYAIVGLAVLLARRAFFAVLAGITVLVAAGMTGLPWLGFRVEGLFLDGQWLMFAAGVGVYYATNYASARTRGWLLVPLGFGVLCAVADPRQLLNPRVGEPNLSYLTDFVFALGLLAVKRWDARLAGARWLWPLRSCGEMCYSLYLVHLPTVLAVTWGFNALGFREPVIVLCGGVFCGLAASVALAWVFHVWVERRFLNTSPLGAPGQAG